jgi:acyl carrier protein
VRLLSRASSYDARIKGIKESGMDELFLKIKKIIAEKLEVEEDKITLEASFRQDLGADSLDTYELVYGIEEELGITIPDEKANEFETVKDAYDFIKSQVK